MASHTDERKRNTYRHGNLRNALIEAGLELAREGGPDQVILRAATRQVGVAPNAAYRHFADRRELLRAVSQAALSRLARAIESELDGLPDADGQPAIARSRLRALVAAYLHFARTEPGIFRTAFAVPGQPDTGEEAAKGASGLTAYELLATVLDDMTDCDVLPAERRPDAEYFVWSAVHGLAVLSIDGPLRGLLPTQARDAEHRLTDSIERGL